MTQKTITCNTAVEAMSLISRLAEEGIESVKFDETNSKIVRGIMDATMGVMVREEDYDRANAIYEQMVSEQESFTPWCPKCGSENVEKLSDTTFHCKDCGKDFDH